MESLAFNLGPGKQDTKVATPQTPDLVLDNPPLLRVASRVIDVVELAALKAAANLSDPRAFPLPDDAKSLERIFGARLATRPEATKQRAAAQAKMALTATDETAARALR